MNNSAGGQIITWNTTSYNLSGKLEIECYGDPYDIYVNGNSTKRLMLHQVVIIYS